MGSWGDHAKGLNPVLDRYLRLNRDYNRTIPTWIPFDPYKDETPFGKDKPK